MKFMLSATLFLGLSAPLFAADGTIDFDGKKIHPAIALFLENIQEPSAPPIKTGRELQTQGADGRFESVPPHRSWLDENGNRVNEYLARPNAKYRWRLLCKSTQQPQWSAKQTYGHTYGSGGHYHYDPPAPPLKVTNITTDTSATPPPDTTFRERPSPILFPTMSVNAEYFFWEWMPLFSTQIVEYFESFGACSAIQTDYLNVIQSTSLIKLSDGVGYELLGQTPEHPENHYVSEAMGVKLVDIGKEWTSACPNSASLKYNDMSLVWGGLFDVNNDWNPPHTTHRFGNNADISKKWTRKGNREKLIRLMCRHVWVQSEGDAQKEKHPHYHLTLRASKHIEDFDEKIINCCPSSADGPIPAACIDLQSHGAPLPEEMPEESDCP